MNQKQKELLQAIEDERAYEYIANLVNSVTHDGKKPKELDFCDDEGKTPLHYVAKFSLDERLVRSIVATCPSLVTKKEKEFGGTALHIAAIYKKLPMIKFLLKVYVDPFKLDKGGHRFMYYLDENSERKEIGKLFWEIIFGTKEVDRYVFNGMCACLADSYSKKREDFLGRLLIFSAFNGDTELMKILIKMGADIEIMDGNALLGAVLGRNTEAVEILLKVGANVHTSNYDAFVCACSLGELKIAELLFEKGADINAQDEEGLVLACMKGERDVVKFLIKNGIDLTTYPARVAFIGAAHEKHIDILNDLMDAGIVLNVMLDTRINEVISYLSDLLNEKPELGERVNSLIEKINQRYKTEEITQKTRPIVDNKNKSFTCNNFIKAKSIGCEIM